MGFGEAPNGNQAFRQHAVLLPLLQYSCLNLTLSAFMSAAAQPRPSAARRHGVSASGVPASDVPNSGWERSRPWRASRCLTGSEGCAPRDNHRRTLSASSLASAGLVSGL